MNTIQQSMTERLDIYPFTLTRLIGKGAMGDVWQARHLEEDIEVAIKFLRSDGVEMDNTLEGLELEARTAAGLNHPGVIVMLDYNTVKEENSSAELRKEYPVQTPYLVMEYAPGDRCEICRVAVVVSMLGGFL